MASFKETYYDATDMLPLQLKNDLRKAILDDREVFEIRLLENSKAKVITDKGTVTSKYLITSKELEDSVLSLTGYSYHSFQREISRGFIHLPNGHRAGLAGTFFYDSQNIKGLKNITGIVIRIANEAEIRNNVLIKAFEEKDMFSAIISGPPCSGKTTYLRDTAKRLAAKGLSVVVTDERQELYKGLQDCMILKGIDKADGIRYAVRNLSPQVLICDEISSIEEARNISYALNCGVRIIASIHAENFNELKRKKMCKELIDSGEFKKALFLKAYPETGSVSEMRDIT